MRQKLRHGIAEQLPASLRKCFQRASIEYPSQLVESFIETFVKDNDLTEAFRNSDDHGCLGAYPGPRSEVSCAELADFSGRQEVEHFCSVVESLCILQGLDQPRVPEKDQRFPEKPSLISHVDRFPLIQSAFMTLREKAAQAAEEAWRKTQEAELALQKAKENKMRAQKLHLHSKNHVRAQNLGLHLRNHVQAPLQEETGANEAEVDVFLAHFISSDGRLTSTFLASKDWQHMLAVG